MEKAIKEAIVTLASRSNSKDGAPDSALKLTQSVLNLTNALVKLKEMNTQTVTPV